MKVRSFFTQRKFKKMMKEEPLSGITINKTTIFHSAHWLILGKTYVPKSYVIGTYSTNPTTQNRYKCIRMYFYLATGEEVFFDASYRNAEDIKGLLNDLRKTLPHAMVLDTSFVLHLTYKKANRIRMAEAVRMRLPDEEAWIAYIREKPEAFLDALAGEHVKQSDYYKTDDSDLHEERRKEEC